MRLYDVARSCGFLQKEPSKRGLIQKNMMSYGSSTVPCATEIREVNTSFHALMANILSDSAERTSIHAGMIGLLVADVQIPLWPF